MPPLPPPARRSGVPWIASIVPVVGALGLWVATGSVFALWFAALGPVIALAAWIDGWRTTRRERRVAAADRRQARARIEAEIARRHERERVAWRARHPDVLGFLSRPDEIWRPVPGREGTLVVGTGEVPSGVRIDGAGAGADDDEVVRALRAAASQVSDAPLTVPAMAGIAVTGPAVLAAAVARALVIQLCCTHPPGRLRVSGAAADELGALPHTAAAPTTCHLDARGAAVRAPGDGAVLVIAEGAVPPPHCAAVLTMTGIDRARLDYAGRSVAVGVEGLGAAQATRIAAALAARAAAVGGVDRVPDAVRFAELGPDQEAGGLAVTIGHDGTGPVRLDLVEDGPHAIVTGMTGAGKSELLVSWVARMCAARSTRDVVFLLADFKGGTAFDALAHLPHVTGVLTDLDGIGAGRALESLRAEIRHREAVIARAAARDIDDPAVELPRLVIVVDELAALLEGHRDLGAVFADVAARGRALGMHLVLGTQRATGVVRDALMANCPLRIGLRVVDAADSRFVLGTDAAAALPGDAAARGLAFIRRASDAVPVLTRIARTLPADIAEVARRRAAEPPPRRPWQPALPDRIDLESLTSRAPADADEPVIGLADEPDRQRHLPMRLHAEDAGLLVVGGPASGKSTAIATIAAQVAPERTIVLSTDPEALWDQVCRISDEGAAPGSLILGDDMDVALVGLPPDYMAAAAAMIEQLCRRARSLECRVVLSTARLTGPLGRIAELLPRRAVLRLPSRLDHAAAGADPTTYDPAAPAGRAQLDGRTVQIAGSAASVGGAAGVTRAWTPAAGTAGLVVRAGGAARRLAAALADAGVTVRDIETDAEEIAGRAEDPGRPTVILGEPEQWQRAWRTLQHVRSRGELLVDASCLVEYRILTGDRMLPPYCVPGRGRAWLLSEGRGPERVVLPGEDRVLRRRAA